MISAALRRLLSFYTLRSGRLLALYRRVCKPDGGAWTRVLERHGGLNAIGSDCLIQANVVFTDPAHVRLGNNVHLTGCTLFGQDGVMNMLKQAYGLPLCKASGIDIRDNVFVGHQAIVMPGVSIGPNAVVASGSVVTGDVAPGCIVGGVPARVIGKLSDLVERLQAESQALPWRDHPYLHPDYTGPSDGELDRQRIEHFFGPAA